jgi:glycosyltransferase involved in cell wall biosynthesis
MKILHTMLSNYFIDDFGYQENLLPRQNARDGHDVRIIASTETFVANQRLGYVAPNRYRNADGIEVERLPYAGWLPHAVMKKVRAYPNVYRLIAEFAPQVILFHGLPALELLTVARYRREHPSVRLYVDSHEDSSNSGTNLLSKWLLHRAFYRSIVQRALPSIDKVLYVTQETKDFIAATYGVPDALMEFYPLGGVMPEADDRLRRRESVRKELGLRPGDLLFVHSGKMDKLKRTEDLLRAFSSVPDSRLRLVLLGSMPPEIKVLIDPLISVDRRISFLGWKSTDEMLSYLSGCDMYLQPGSQSATMQNALCAFAPVMLFPYPSHRPYLKDNGYFVETVADMAQCFRDISRNPGVLKSMSENSEKLARAMLDYRKLAARLYV